MDEKQAVLVLRELRDIFNKHNVRFWLDCGTLLGAVRDGRFIPGDNNINLSILYCDHDTIQAFNGALTELKKTYKWFFWELGMAPSLIKGSVETELHLVHFNGGFFHYHSLVPYRSLGRFLNFLLHTLDLCNPELRAGYGSSLTLTSIFVSVFSFIPKKIRSSLWKLVFCLYKRLDIIYVESTLPKQYFEQFETVTFYGMAFLIPANVDRYLTFRYGDWKNPQLSYSGGAVTKRYLYGGVQVKGPQIYGRKT